MMNKKKIITLLQSMADPDKVEFKRRKFAIHANKSLGVYHADLKTLAKSIGENDKLAVQLFDSGIYEARLLCSKIHSIEFLTEEKMDQWVVTFENWEICDSFCMGFFAKSQFAIKKTNQWSTAEAEYVKRAGFVIMASYGFAHKEADNSIFLQFLSLIEKEADDQRLYVKKALNWALRNIGKRNIDLHTAALASANRILKSKQKSAQWIAKNALKELENPSVNMLHYPRHIYKKVINSG